MVFVSDTNKKMVVESVSLNDFILYSFNDNKTTTDLNFICAFSGKICIN